MLWRMTFVLSALVVLNPLTAQAGSTKPEYKPMRAELVTEILARTAGIGNALKQAAIDQGVKPEEVDPADVPGRGAFIQWALSTFSALEKEGAIFCDDRVLEFQAMRDSARPACHASIPTGVVIALGDLKAEEAVETLSRFMLLHRGSIGTLANDYIEYVFPSVGALEQIGEPSLPAMLDNIRKKEHPRILEFSAQVIGVVLKEDALEYFDGEIAKETDPVVKAKLESVRPRIKNLALKAKGARLKQEEMDRAAAEAKERELAAEVIE